MLREIGSFMLPTQEGGGQGGGLAIFRNGNARFTKVPSKPESDKNVEKPSFF